MPGYIASKKKAVPQTTANNLLANGGSANTPLADLLKGELSSRKKDEKAMMRVVSVDSCNFTFENCPNEEVTGGDHEIVGYKQVVFLNVIEGDKNMNRVINYNFDLVKNALRASIQMLNFDGRGIKINPILVAEFSPALLVFGF